MPFRPDIERKLIELSDQGVRDVFSSLRKTYLDQISRATNRNVILYYTGWLRPANNSNEYSINANDINGFMQCLHGLDAGRGLDLILHTGGGSVTAAESIVNYLHSHFKEDIRCIVPQSAMSAGTLIALSCPTVVMGKQSSLGPVDPMLGNTPCQALIDEYHFALEEIASRPGAEQIWAPIFSQVPPGFLTQCIRANDLMKELLEQYLKERLENAEENLERAMALFWQSSAGSKVHDRHFNAIKCPEVGVNVLDLELDNSLQDLVLSLHHLMILLFEKMNFVKVIDNQRKTDENPGYLLQYFG